MKQPGYDALAELYTETFPSPYLTPLERHVVHAFADLVAAQDGTGVVVDVGCGPGEVTADLAQRGLNVLGVDPSAQMLAIAHRKYPECRFTQDDAYLSGPEAPENIDAVLARFSLIHVPPAEIPAVLSAWRARMKPGALLAVACQAADGATDTVVEFDHLVTRAWRWHPDHLAKVLADAGFDEMWRTISQPDDDHRFPEVHLVARLRSRRV